jgi:hypothetical protein
MRKGEEAWVAEPSMLEVTGDGEGGGGGGAIVTKKRV